MAIHLSPCPPDKPRPDRRYRWMAYSLASAVVLAGCGGGTPENGQGVPTDTQLAQAQADLDGTVPTDDSIEAKQAALDADADKDPE